MAMTSQTRGHTVANPIDRFILMMHQVAQSGPALLAMRHVGVYYLLEAVVRGRYDAYNRDMEDPTGIQDKLRLNPVVRMHTALKDHDRAMQKGESKLLCEEAPIRRCSITLSNTEDYLL